MNKDEIMLRFVTWISVSIAQKKLAATSNRKYCWDHYMLGQCTSQELHTYWISHHPSLLTPPKTTTNE